MDFLATNMSLVLFTISCILLIAIYFAFKYKIDLWWLNLWYSLPFVGRIARLSRDSTRYPKDNSWTNSERKLCEDYKNFVHFSDEESFKRRLDYLSRAQDTGRTPLPGWMFFVLGVLLVAEGLGFSYLLGTWMAMEGSENTHQILMIAIVFVLAIVMLFVTHQAGHQTYRTNLIRRCNKEWRDDGQPERFASHPELSLQKDLESPTSLDAKQPPYTQCVNRVGTSGSYLMLYIAVLAIIVIAVTSTWMRVKHLEAMQSAETMGTPQAALTSSTLDPANPFANLPPELAVPQAVAEIKGGVDTKEATAGEGIMAFAMLGFIFIITQIVAIAAGYKWGFAGKNSNDAYKGTRGFVTYDDYLNFFEPAIQTAQSKLQSLQQAMAERDGNKGLALKKSFTDYLIEKSTERTDLRNRTTTARTMSNQPGNTTSDFETDIQTHLAQIEAMGDDKTSKLNYLASLSHELQQRIKDQLQRDMEARKSQIKSLESGFEGLL